MVVCRHFKLGRLNAGQQRKRGRVSPGEDLKCEPPAILINISNVALSILGWFLHMELTFDFLADNRVQPRLERLRMEQQ